MNSKRCYVPGCDRHVSRDGQVICRKHWFDVPEDLQERLRWAFENGTSVEKQAAVLAALDALQEGA